MILRDIQAQGRVLRRVKRPAPVILEHALDQRALVRAPRPRPAPDCPHCHGRGVEDWAYLGLDPCRCLGRSAAND